MACESPDIQPSGFHCSPDPLRARRAAQLTHRQRPARRNLPDLAEDFAANTFAASLAARHHTLRRGDNGDSKTTLDAADLVAAHVHAAAGARDTLQVADRGL